MLALLAHVVVAMTAPAIAVGRVALHLLAHLVATTRAPHALAVVATTAPTIAVGRVALHLLAHLAATIQAPHALAVVATILLALDHPLVALGLRPPHHGAAAHLVVPLLLAAVLEDADSRHF